MKRFLLPFTLLALVVMAMAAFSADKPVAMPYAPLLPPGHPPMDLLVIDSNILFPTAKTCGGCHGRDSNMLALVSNTGDDINMYDDWRSSIMGNSAKDPFWRAKVRHEVLVNPGHSLALQDKCTSCHAPAGHYQAKLHDYKPYYVLADLLSDTLGLDGVTCQACHAQAPGNLGSLHSGKLHFDTNHIRVAYGPYEVVFAPPMQQFVGVTPKYGEHIGDAGLCAGCHTLITDAVDLQGNPTGTSFVEQATYHEWLNSRYDSDQDNITCQGCHLPRTNDEVIISGNYQFLTPKFPYGLHTLVGGNTAMLEIMRDHRAALGINALPEQFDSTIAATLRQLQTQTLDVSLEALTFQGDSAVFELKLVNKAGHKFPSGYPSRRAWVEFEVKDAAGAVIFHSGGMQADYSLAGESEPFEPHYQQINRSDQVQIYELTTGDVNGNFTNVLERAVMALKDNRLTPQGFKRSDPVYDTTQIVGAALFDPDFNRLENGEEGSGADRIRYVLPIGQAKGVWSVSAKVWYQSLPPRWVNPMFDFSAPEIDYFKTLYTPSAARPVLIASANLPEVYVNPVSQQQVQNGFALQIFPTVSADGIFFIHAEKKLSEQQIRIQDASGRVVPFYFSENQIIIKGSPGVYYCTITNGKEKKVKKMIKI